MSSHWIAWQRGEQRKLTLGLPLLAGALVSLVPEYAVFIKALQRGAEGDDEAYQVSPEIFYTTASEIHWYHKHTGLFYIWSVTNKKQFLY